MSRRWLCGKNLFAMFNSGYIDAVRHSLRHNSYECYLCLVVVGKSSSQEVLPCLSKTPPFNSRPDEGGSRARGAVGSAGRGSGRLGHLAPSSSTRAGVWAGRSGPAPGGRRLSRTCPSARRGRLSIREETFPYITIHCLIYGSCRRLVTVTVVENRRRALMTHAKGPFIDIACGFPLDRGLWVTNLMQDGVLRRINYLRRSPCGLLLSVGRLAVHTAQRWRGGRGFWGL